MKRLIASLVFAIDRRLPGARVGGRESGAAYSKWEYETGKGIIASYAEHLGSLEGKDVLDIGCGLGGKSVAYAEAGAQVIGVDIEQKNVAQSIAFSRSCGAPARFLAGDAERLPFGDASFDLVIANDSLEHFRDPAAAMYELARVLKPGGSLFLFFTPWRSPLGSHLYDYIHTPWCHLVFPEWLIRGLLERSLAARGNTGPAAEAERLMGEYHGELNRITVGKYRQILRQIKSLQVVREELRPPKFGWLAPCAKIPLVGELFTGTVIGILRASPGS
jgi:SAM-dependent methyltransferase